METFRDREVIFCTNEAEWEQWLAKNYTRHDGVWLKIAKKSSGIRSVTHMESLDGALCCGWIDGQGMPYDETYYLQKYTPRRPKSQWSKVNVAKVEALIAAGRMQEPGLSEINAAKTDGRWEAAYAPMSELTAPDDFAA
ncbi:MAG: OmdA domain containing protein, partial [Candidatus Saccharimonadales bacterium]